MTIRVTLISLLLASTVMGEQAGANRISEGDPLSKVRKCLGTPAVEFPLKGKLIQKYEHCSIISSNGVVLSATYKEAIPAPSTIDEPAPEKKAPATIQDIKDRAMQGDAEAQYILAYCFQFGQSVDQDLGVAVGWYVKSAMQGYMSAQHNLGFLYMKGKGVEQDYEEAYAWALLAASNGNGSLRKALVHRLSQEQKWAGEQRAGQIQSQPQTKQAQQKHNALPPTTHTSSIAPTD